MGDREKRINDIIQEEWKQFDGVKNQGGRASCQDDWETFQIMRKSQYMPWPDELLDSILKDLQEAAAIGHNLMTEKYARMMESTAPEEYAAFKDRLPYRSSIRLKRQEDVIAQEVIWNEILCEKYPYFAGHGRKIHTAEDTSYATSVETYLRGEMTTWSDRTFNLYESWINTLKKTDGNLAQMTAETMVKFYGFPSIEQAEQQLRGNTPSNS